MGLAGGGGGALAGWVVGVSSYATLGLAAFTLAAVIAAFVVADLVRSPRGSDGADVTNG